MIAAIPNVFAAAEITSQVTLGVADIVADISSRDDNGGVDDDFQTQIKWNLTDLPAQASITNAQLCFYLDTIDVGADDDVTVERIANQTWDESITAGQYDALATSSSTAQTFNDTTAGQETCVNVLTQLQLDYSANNEFASFRLSDPDEPHDGGTDAILDGAGLIVGGQTAATDNQLFFNDSEDGGAYPTLTITYVTFVPSGGAVTAGAQERFNNATSANVSAVNGNLSENNLSIAHVTLRWGAFYGQVQGATLLAAGANYFYNWTISDMTNATVIAANESVGSFENITIANETDVPSYLQVSAADNFTNTFNTTKTFLGPSIGPIENARYTVTQRFGASDHLETYALKSADASTLMWVSKVIDDTTSFKNTLTDFQMLVPAQNNTIYYFYLDLP